ncbi:MAG: hypothetical protein IJ801_07540 [Lachnospiraceae bacterium]|nr:hypothetical protein [Lachnospiraceae bacterium]
MKKYKEPEESSYDAGEPLWWWLRSSGCQSDLASYVSYDSLVDTYGDSVEDTSKGIRPVLHYNLSSGHPLLKKQTMTSEVVNVPEDTTVPEGYGQTDPPSEIIPFTPTDPTTQDGSTTSGATTGSTTGTTTTGTGTTVTTRQGDNPTTLNIKNSKTYKTSKKITIKDADGIKKIKLNSKTIKVKNGKTKYSFKLSTYKKYLKKAGKWNKLVVTDKTEKKKTVKFKTR